MTSVVVHALWTGLALSIYLSLSFWAIALFNLEVWLRDFPPDIQEAWGPQGDAARRQKWILGVPVLGLALAGLIWSTMRVDAAAGGLGFVPVFLHAFIALSVFNLVDLLILDWLIFVKIRPGVLVLPGTEGLAGYGDYRFHWNAFLVGTAGISVLSLVLAAVFTLL